ncbi:hypothetical protein RDI58_019805 [Solanum bulbocastanum]
MSQEHDTMITKRTKDG